MWAQSVRTVNVLQTGQTWAFRLSGELAVVDAADWVTVDMKSKTGVGPAGTRIRLLTRSTWHGISSDSEKEFPLPDALKRWAPLKTRVLSAVWVPTPRGAKAITPMGGIWFRAQRADQVAIPVATSLRSVPWTVRVKRLVVEAR